MGKNLVAELTARGYTSLLCFEKNDTPRDPGRLLPPKAAFVVHLAGINRPKDPSEFYSGNAGLTDTMLSPLGDVRQCLPGAGDLQHPGGAGQRLRQEQKAG